jgi:hypothetical protein
MSLRSQHLAIGLAGPGWILDRPVTACRKSHRAKLSTGFARDSGTACDDQKQSEFHPSAVTGGSLVPA